MRYEDLKIHIAEVERRWRHPQTKSVPPVLFPENLWENETLQLKPGDCQRGSTTNNFDIITLDVCLPPRIFISFAMISNNKLFHPDSRTILAHIHKKFFFRGTWRLIEMAKWVLAEPTTDTVSAWGEVISSHFSQIFHGIATLDYQLLDLQALFIFYVLIINLMKLSASNDISMIFQGTVEEWNSKFPHFKTLLPLTCIHTNALKFYSLLLNLVKITIQYGNYKEISTWKGNYAEFTYVLRYLTKYSWWIHLPPSASIILHSWFK